MEEEEGGDGMDTIGGDGSGNYGGEWRLMKKNAITTMVMQVSLTRGERKRVE